MWYSSSPLRESGRGVNAGRTSRLATTVSKKNTSARGYNDGYLYSMVRYGRLLMPQYGDKIVRIDERWAVVDYVRSLQAKSPAPAPTPAAAAKKGAP